MIGLVVVWGLACTSPSPTQPADLPEAPANPEVLATPPPEETPESPTPGEGPASPPSDDASQDGRVAKAIERLSARLGVAAEEIQLREYEEVQWNNGAIGCPEPGLAYTQALVPGFRIVLEHRGTSYAFHGREGGEPSYCASPG